MAALPTQTCGTVGLPPFCPRSRSSQSTKMEWNTQPVKGDVGWCAFNGIAPTWRQNAANTEASNNWCNLLQVANESNEDNCIVTDYVAVPSSQHVAEIVGRQGCKIKALRLNTNTYIKTPERWEKPVFVIVGRRADVTKARCELVCASEYFTKLREGENIPVSGSVLVSGPVNTGHNQIAGPVNTGHNQITGPVNTGHNQITGPVNTGHNQTTIQVRLPYCVVHLDMYVDQHGTTVQRVKQVSPIPNGPCSDDKNGPCSGNGKNSPCSGNGKNILKSVENTNENETVLKNERNSNVSSSIDLQNTNDDICDPKPNTSLYSNTFTNGTQNTTAVCSDRLNSNDTHSSFKSSYSNIGESNTDSSLLDVCYQTTSVWGELSRGVMFTLPNTNVAVQSVMSKQQTDSVYPTPTTDRKSPSPNTSPHSFSSHSENVAMDTSSPEISDDSPCTSTHSGSPSENKPEKPEYVCSTESNDNDSKLCVICDTKERVAALVPCGHNLFCMECANLLLKKSYPECPVCHQPANLAIRIWSSW